VFARRLKIMKIFKWFFVFLFFIDTQAHALTDKVYKELSTFTKILELVDQYYVDEVKDEELIHGAIKGMLFGLDAHTVYLPAEIYRDFKSDTKGRFGGVGIEVTVQDGFITVVAPIEDSPADKANIKSGDRILSIDGKSAKSMSLGEAVHLMRGPIGKKVILGIWQREQKQANSIALKRELIKVENVKLENLSEGYGYFRITSFQEGTAKNLKNAIENFEKEYGELKGIMLDLRDNPGGLLSEAVKISDYFLKTGVIVSTKGRTQIQDVKRAHLTGTLPEIPVVVLVNHGSASAAEIVAGALQDHARAKIIGTKSYGKGSVQTVIDLDGGDALKITIAHYLTPKNRMIDGKGIDPDVKVDQKDFKKKMKQDGTKVDEDSELTREGYMIFQKQEALKYLKKMK